MLSREDEEEVGEGVFRVGVCWVWGGKLSGGCDVYDEESS